MASRSIQPNPPASRGRPRSQRARNAILDAARELLDEGGYPAATIEAIAARSGVAKSTIYRWWPSRAALVVELMLNLAAEVAPLPAGKDPLMALRTELRLVAKAANALPGRLLLSLLSEAQNNPQVREALQRGLVNPRRNARARVIRQAQLSGTLRDDVPPLLAADLLYGPFFYRMYVLQEPVQERFIQRLFEHFVAGLAPHRDGPKPRRRGRRP